MNGLTAPIRLPLPTRVALRLLSRAAEGGERLVPWPLTAYVSGRRVRAHMRWCRSDVAIFHEVYGEQAYEIDFESLLGDVRTVVDVGAHIGLASLFFRARFPAARLVSVEPLPHNAVVLERNRRRHAHDWSVVVGAVGAGATVTLHWSRWWSSGSAVESIGSARQSDPRRPEHRVAEAALTVATVDVDTLVPDGAIDVLKLDVEGAEEQLLAGRDAAWLRRVRCLLVEVHDKYVDGSRVRAAIAAAGLERLPVDRGRTEVYVRPPT